MLLLPHGIRLLNKSEQLFAQILRSLDTEMMGVVLPRERLHFHKAGTLVSFSQHQMSNQSRPLNLDSRKRHADLKSNSSFFRQDYYSAAIPNFGNEQVEKPAHRRRFAIKVRPQSVPSTRVRLVAISELPAANRASPEGH